MRYFFLTAVVFIACSTASQPPLVPTYEFSLSSVERQERGGKAQTFQPTDVNTFEDDYVRVVWQPPPTQLQFKLMNKTTSSMRMLWDDASFVGVDGSGDRIMHQGIKFTDRSASMPPTLIVRGASLEDLIAPASNVFWREGYGRYDVGSWESRPLIGAGGSSANAAGPNDRTIKVLLPLESTGKVQEYLFIFDVHARAAALDDQAQVPEIKIVRDRAKIQDCRLLGMIEAHPPYIWPGDDFKQLTRKASSLGADTILVPGSRIGTVEGEAYRCAGN